MKQLTCEMCGGTNLVKQDGMFVCQSCGCKYTLEEARKLMGVDGAPAEAAPAVGSATVKVDTSEKLTKLYQIARRARDDNNAENAAKYYDLILQEDPMSWEASFYTVYFQAMQTKIGAIESAANRVHNCLGSVLGLIVEHVPAGEQAKAVGEVAVKVGNISTMLANAARNHYDGIDASIKNKYTQEYIDQVCAARDTLYDLGDMIEKTFEDEDIRNLAAALWQMGIALHKTILPRLADQVGNNRTIDRYAAKVGKYDASYATGRKAETIQAEIASLDREIAGINTTGAYKFTGSGKSMIFLGVMRLIFPYLMFSMGATDMANLGNFFVVALDFCVGLMMFFGGIGDVKRKKNLGILWIVVGAYLLLNGFNLFKIITGSAPFLPPIPFSSYLIDLLYIGYGVWIGTKNKPTKETIEANIKRAADLQAERDELQKELAELGV